MGTGYTSYEYISHSCNHIIIRVLCHTTLPTHVSMVFPTKINSIKPFWNPLYMDALLHHIHSILNRK